MTAAADDPVSLAEAFFAAGSEANFRHPWEARAFAMIVCMAEAGHFTWQEWVDTLSRQVALATQAATKGDREPSYYEQWLDAAEALLVARGVTSPEQLRARRIGAWPIEPAHVARGR